MHEHGGLDEGKPAEQIIKGLGYPPHIMKDHAILVVFESKSLPIDENAQCAVGPSKW